ncbi:MAG: CHAT domain-containing protein [SAR324 cluster bacterium]|uniref:CHAT domain-containing protein n=1 Tax=SAR324 cluster bacterium TaxID=2024889 RepID=A0A7X9FTD1_9DELT|nr:CHAT domain-containing protein [SAR324 cluster bacterium]
MQGAIDEFSKSVSIDPNHPYSNHKLALNSLFKGNFEEAFQRIQIAEREYNKLGNRAKLAECHLFMGSVLLQMGKDIHAIQKLESALDLYEKEHDLRGQTNALSQMGSVYYQVGNYDKALTYLQKAYDIFESNKDFDGMVHVLGVQALTSYAKAMHSDETYTATISIAQKALKIGREQHLNLFDNLLMSISALGAAYWQNDDKTQLKELISEAEQLKDKFQMPMSRFTFDIMIGKGYERLDQLDLAELHLGRAMKALSEGNVKTLSAFINASCARLKEKQGELEEAHRLYDLAIKEHERFRGDTQTLSFKMAAGERMLSTYNEAIEFLIDTKDYAGAFNLAERSKARSFLDLIGTKLESSESAANRLIEEERKLQFAMSKLEEQLAQASSAQSGQESPKVKKIKTELDNNRALYTQLIERIKKERPELSSLLTVNPSNISEIQSLLDDDTTILEYYITEKRTFLWVVSKKILSLIEIPIKQKVLKQKVNSFRDSISSLSNDYKHQAIDLYDLLIRPALSHITNKRLAIVPHSVLHYLPFQALIDSNKTNSQDDLFLIQQYDVFYLPSASLVKFTISKRKQKTDSVLAFGNPDTEGKSIDLIYAAKEVESIKKIYPDALVFFGAEASKKKLKQFANQFSIVHFASHAELNSQSPMLSSLKLSSEKDGEGDLQLHEVFHLNLSQTSLVVLSACETGLGKLTTGDEVNSLSRGFIYAGSPSVIASLWKVSDESTATLMSHFYSNLQSSDKAKSLRIAQIELISGETGKGIVRDANEVLSRGHKIKKTQSFTVNGTHPFFWAPFVLIGDWQ